MPVMNFMSWAPVMASTSRSSAVPLMLSPLISACARICGGAAAMATVTSAAVEMASGGSSNVSA